MRPLNTNVSTEQRGWPPSLRFVVVQLLLLAYTLYTLHIVIAHVAMMAVHAQVADVSGEDYLMPGNLFTSVADLPLKALEFGAFAALAFIFFIMGLFAGRFKNRRYGPFELIGTVAVVIASYGAVHVGPRLKDLSRYDRVSQPDMQKEVCDAVQLNRPEDLVKLLQAGADPDSMITNEKGNSVGALVLAVMNNNEKCVDLLLKWGATPVGAGMAVDGFVTALDHAVGQNNFAIARKLIAAGASPNNPDSNAVEYATQNDNYAMAEFLFQQGLNKREYDNCDAVLKQYSKARMLALLHKYKPKN